MLNISGIQEGVVLDHIQAGKSMDIYRYLRLGELDCTVAIIKNAKSNKMGRKDIIKIEDAQDVDLDVLGLVARQATVDIIHGGQIVNKQTPTLPERVVNVITCVNPRCVTTTEPGIDQVFYLDHTDDEVYRCRYCDEEAKF